MDRKYHNIFSNPADKFWTSRTGLIIQVVIVLIPPLTVLKSGTLLLAGLAAGLLLSWLGLRLQQRSWKDLGLASTKIPLKIIFIVFVSLLITIPLSWLIRLLVTSLAGLPPDLSAFNPVKNNIKALAAGLAIAWIFGAFCEELFFRGFLMNTLFRIIPERIISDKLRWVISLVICSILTGLGHFYQGITGMIVTGILAALFASVYLVSGRNMWANILTHGLYDSVAFAMLFSGISFDSIIK